MPKGKLLIIKDAQEEVVPEKKQKSIKKSKEKKKKTPSLVENYQQSHQLPFDKVAEQQIAEQVELEQTKIAHLAICFPDSILEIPQTSALRAYFISEIARISSIFKVDEIIVLRDHGYSSKSEKFIPCEYVARNLQYLETPQYLRKHLFKMHPDLNNVGLMNPIEAMHHLRADEACEFREGVALQRPTKFGSGSWVDVGLRQQARMNHLVLPLTRVTLRLKNFDNPHLSFYEAEAISKKTPRIEKGLYWGYDVRIANNLKEMVEGGNYDYSVLCNHSKQSYNLPQIQNFSGLDLSGKSVLIFFTGIQDLDKLISKDEHSKWTLPETLNCFNYSMRHSSLGVKQLRLQQQLFLTLSKLEESTL